MKLEEKTNQTPTLAENNVRHKPICGLKKVGDSGLGESSTNQGDCVLSGGSDGSGLSFSRSRMLPDSRQRRVCPAGLHLLTVISVCEAVPPAVEAARDAFSPLRSLLLRNVSEGCRSSSFLSEL